MEDRVDGLWLMRVDLLKKDIAEAGPYAREHKLLEFVEFVMSGKADRMGVVHDGAAEIGELLKTELWVVPVLARMTSDALSVWQSVAQVVFERLNNSDDIVALEVRLRLAKAIPPETSKL